MIHVLLDHGSKRPSAHQDLVDLAQKVQSQSGIPCYAAHMEIAEPSLESLLHSLNLQAQTQVYVIPWFLSSGRHLQEDIPAIVHSAREVFEYLDIKLCAPLRDSEYLASAALALVHQAQ